MIPILYGIKTCDTVRKARRWLDDHGIEYRFHDFRTDGLDRAKLSVWVNELGWEKLLNRRGTTWRQLSEELRSNIDEAKSEELMESHPALIKRPLLDLGTKRIVGFNADDYSKLFLK